MADTLLNLTIPSLPGGTCYPATPQELATLLFGLSQAVFPGTITGVYVNTTAPADITKVWIKVDVSNNYVGTFTFGAYGWAAPHPLTPSSKMRTLFVGSLADLQILDGGNANAVAPADGPFWEEDTDFRFKIPIGPGTNGTTYDGNPATVIAVGDTGGEERHTILTTESASHQHFTVNADTGGGIGSLTASKSITYTNDPGEGVSSTNYVLEGTVTAPTVGLTSAVGGALSHQNMPPYRGVYVIKRTSRIYQLG